jgi:hypothetical protein
MSEQPFDPVWCVGSDAGHFFLQDAGQFLLQPDVSMLHLNTGRSRPSCGENAIAITTAIAKSVRKGPFTAFPSWTSEHRC